MKILRFPSSRLLACVALIGFMAAAGSVHAQSSLEGPAVSAANAQQIAALQKVADHWDEALDQRDQYALELVLAPEYIEITDTGNVLSRDQVVSELITKGAAHYQLTQKVITVRVLGDVAVVNGTYDRVFPAPKMSHDKKREERGVYSQVYIRARNSWACINSQQTRIEGTPEKSGKKSKDGDKALNEDMGFHFPSFH